MGAPYDNPYTKLTTREEFIAAAANEEITILPWDFTEEDGSLYLDGMPAAEWLDAMTME